MPERKLTTNEFINLLEPFANPLRLDYSGRRMSGDTCVAFDVISMSEALGIAAEVTREAGKQFGIDADETREICRLFSNARTDDMGTDFVVYFPTMETVQEAEAVNA